MKDPHVTPADLLEPRIDTGFLYFFLASPMQTRTYQESMGAALGHRVSAPGRPRPSAGLFTASGTMTMPVPERVFNKWRQSRGKPDQRKEKNNVHLCVSEKKGPLSARRRGATRLDKKYDSRCRTRRTPAECPHWPEQFTEPTRVCQQVLTNACWLATCCVLTSDILPYS